MLLLVNFTKSYFSNFIKSNTPPVCFLRFLNCVNGTKTHHRCFFSIKMFVHAVFYFLTAAEEHILSFLTYIKSFFSFFNAFARWTNNWVGTVLQLNSGFWKHLCSVSGNSWFYWETVNLQRGELITCWLNVSSQHHSISAMLNLKKQIWPYRKLTFPWKSCFRKVRRSITILCY